MSERAIGHGKLRYTPARVNPCEICGSSSREDVDLGKEEGGDKIPECSLDGSPAETVLQKGLGGRSSGSSTKVKLRDSEDEDGECGEEQKECSNAGESKREP